MKVNDLAKELNISIRELSEFFKIHNFRVNIRQNPKLTPQKVQEIKKLYARVINKNKIPQNVELEGRQVSVTSVNVTLGALIKTLGLTLSDVMQFILKSGRLLNINSEINKVFIDELAEHFNLEVTYEMDQKKHDTVIKDTFLKVEEKEIEHHIDQLQIRPPVIAIMGHVDHGKTLLLDTIRKTNVVDKESGGITQHIGAYQIQKNNQKLTFLDTPGHQAFTSLRARGAQITDITILVVAADDGVKPQTEEAIHHAKAAGVPIIVAINKIDKPDIDLDRCKQQLSEHDLLSEDWGGKTVMVPISAKTGKGIDDLIDMIILTADMLELKAIHHGPGTAVVIESNLSKQKGAIATLLVKSGKLSVGDFFVVGHQMGKVKAMFNDLNEKVTHGYPGDPIEILGCAKVPLPGQFLESKLNEKACREAIEKMDISPFRPNITLENVANKIGKGELEQLNIIIKTDVNGSLEAITSMLNNVENKKVPLNIIHAATGEITESDVSLSLASNAVVVGFCVSINPDAEKLGIKNGISVKTYRIIYELVDDITAILKGMMKKEYEFIEIGRAEVRELYKFSKTGVIAGSYVLSGKINKKGEIALLRGKEELFRGKLNSLRRFKDDVKEVVEKYECGIVIEKCADIKQNDIVVCYEKREVI